MRIAEIFRSIQGEGRLTGTESIFVRTSGCNLRCSFCDTPYASWDPEGEELSVRQIGAEVRRLAQLESSPVEHVVLTGGEPMMFADLVPLCAMLREGPYRITIETSATLYLPVECDLMSISPKLSNSTPSPQRDAGNSTRHESNRRAPDVVRRLLREYAYQVKFVIDRPKDCRGVEAYLAEFPEIDRSRTMLMPQGTDAEDLAAKAKWLVPYCRQHDLEYCPRRQIEWFGGERGT